MAEALLITLILIVVTIAGILAFLYFVQITQTNDNQKKIKLQGVVKQPVVSTSLPDLRMLVIKAKTNRVSSNYLQKNAGS